MFYEEKKTYLELFLENNSAPREREIYFEEEQEEAIIKYNSEETSDREKNRLFEEVIITAFKKIISGVLEMKQFRNIFKSKKINREELIELTFFRLVEKIHKFRPDMIGKNGTPVKAFSYFSTVAKNFILELIKKNEKILKNKADVETSIDLSILSEDTLVKISSKSIEEDFFYDYISVFSNSKNIILGTITDIILEQEEKEKKDEDLIKVGYYLRYLITHWDKLEFKKKNEFMRLLTLYTGLSQQKVSLLFKKFKIAAIKKINPELLNKKKVVLLDETDEEDDYLEEEIEEEIDTDYLEEEIVEKEEETEEEKILKYDINSFEEFENREIKIENIKTREEWRLRKNHK